MSDPDFGTVDRPLISAFREGAARFPDAMLTVSSAQRAGTHRLADITAQGLRFAAGLRARGIGAGDIVAVQLPAWAEWMIACVGIAHSGAAMLPIVSIYGAKELGFILRQSGAKLLVTPDRWRSADYAQVLAACGDLPALGAHVVIGDAVPAGAVDWRDMLLDPAATPPTACDPDALAMLVYTSGTTADPKGVCHSSRSLLSELAAVAHARRGIEEIILSPWPPGHVAGACTMMRFLTQGRALVLMDQWDPAEAAMLIERHRVSSASFTPFHLAGILDAADCVGRDLSSLVNCLVGAAPVPPTLIERCAARGLSTFRSYGSSEHPTVTTGYPDDPMHKRLTTEGRAMTGSRMRFVDDAGDDVPPGANGEIVTRGPELFTGYFDPSLNAAAMLPDGWYRTGDIGHLDRDGYLVISDRKKDIIIRGGENISSREVEDVLLADPMVQEAAVVACPDARMGEIVCAFITPRPGARVNLESVRAHFADAGIARQKTPERVIIVDALPRNTTGKVLKHELRARVRRDAGT
ncbi:MULTISPECIES: AMP-binding protein [Sphingomonas]|jgi:acyl-CoA synthetase (AMP-forming)/AMP-acid ligase II|uniref:Cyclohexanecarboxylate-CoA ligase n=1 Tax=Sphingomonas olei TaxID=1886787 RepID=A0ABY2QEM4_9SPHN|nr:AMP-binding protein [Sphingomonas olei]THG37863.1 cyclohexanecarboxylate-CoA ligase [Sphingomonas olei]